MINDQRIMIQELLQKRKKKHWYTSESNSDTTKTRKDLESKGKVRSVEGSVLKELSEAEECCPS